MLLYFHGGGFFFGSARSHRHLIARLAERAGATAISVDYRLAPEHAFPGAVEDALGAYRALLARAIDPSRIVVAGDSAGGNLAAALAVRIRMEALPQPGGLYLLSPWLDLTLSGDSYDTRCAADPLLDRTAMARSAEMYLQGRNPRDPLASPLLADLSVLAPMFIQVGSDEVLLSDSTAFAARAGSSGVDVGLRIWQGMIHAWPLFHPSLSAGGRAIEEAGAWIAARLSV